MCEVLYAYTYFYNIRMHKNKIFRVDLLVHESQPVHLWLFHSACPPLNWSHRPLSPTIVGAVNDDSMSSPRLPPLCPCLAQSHYQCLLLLAFLPQNVGMLSRTWGMQGGREEEKKTKKQKKKERGEEERQRVDVDWENKGIGYLGLAFCFGGSCWLNKGMTHFRVWLFVLGVVVGWTKGWFTLEFGFLFFVTIKYSLE